MTAPALLLLLAAAQRSYYRVALAKLATSAETHVEICGPVVYVRRQQDGDWHVTLDDGTAKVVAEIIPSLPLQPPRKGQIVRLRGIRRYDDRHGWPEVHPVESIAVERRCGS